MQIEITTHDRQADYDLMQSSSLSRGAKVQIGDGVALSYEGALLRKAEGFPSVIALAAEFGVAVTAQIAANAIWAYLASRLKKPPVKLTIEHIDVEFEEGKVKRLIVETLKKEPAEG
jgi:hypothetical protein